MNLRGDPNNPSIAIGFGWRERENRGNMSLTSRDKADVKALWAKISKSSDVIGVEVVSRFFTVYPQTRSYFKHWPDMTPGSEPMKADAKKIMAGIGVAVTNMDNLLASLSDLSVQHAADLKVDPANFRIMSHCILVVVSMMFPLDFTPEAHIAFDKFLCAVCAGLSDKYR